MAQSKISAHVDSDATRNGAAQLGSYLRVKFHADSEFEVKKGHKSLSNTLRLFCWLKLGVVLTEPSTAWPKLRQGSRTLAMCSPNCVSHQDAVCKCTEVTLVTDNAQKAA